MAEHTLLDMCEAESTVDGETAALKRADVGIAMGVKGSEAAREASSVVLLDDNFASIAAAVRYLDTPSITFRGVLGTPVVLGAVAAVIFLQLLFTYLPWFQSTFETSALSLEMLIFACLAGVMVLVILEIETRIRRRWWPVRLN